MMRAGHTRITEAALRHTIETIAAHAFSVPRSDVAAVLDDDSGRLAARVSVKLALPLLLGPRRGPDGGTVFDRSRAARTAIITRGLDLTGRTLSSVDIRLSGAAQHSGTARVDAPAGAPAGAPRRNHKERKIA
ncbi:hypothetical protein [Arthrobacter sp. NicSoilC12]|uniref:hypothetical protein n=1 Tax=Arthrobacter sp. NicSoilC12 TaxID=2831001 RepID=UPI0035B564F5